MQSKGRLLGVACCLAIAGCGPQGTGAPVSGSVSLRCNGTGTVQIQRDGVDQPAIANNESVIHYRWNDETKSLVTEHIGTEATAFCHDEGQEECSATMTNGKLMAKSFDMQAGDAPDAISTFGENIEIDTAAMTGKAVMQTSVGTMTDEAVTIHMKTTVTIPLTCTKEQ